jgi:hypothetical protein
MKRVDSETLRRKSVAYLLKGMAVFGALAITTGVPQKAAQIIHPPCNCASPQLLEEPRSRVVERARQVIERDEVPVWDGRGRKIGHARSAKHVAPDPAEQAGEQATAWAASSAAGLSGEPSGFSFE